MLQLQQISSDAISSPLSCPTFDSCSSGMATRACRWETRFSFLAGGMVKTLSTTSSFWKCCNKGNGFLALLHQSWRETAGTGRGDKPHFHRCAMSRCTSDREVDGVASSTAEDRGGSVVSIDFWSVEQFWETGIAATDGRHRVHQKPRISACSHVCFTNTTARESQTHR